jgi:hypothetical protein
MAPPVTRFALLFAATLSACSAPSPVVPTATRPTIDPVRGLAGRWVLAPGECVVPEGTESAPEDPAGAVVSPAGNQLTLARGGAMTSRQGDFILRGTWKFDGTTLRLVVEPPPRRLEMGFLPVVEVDRLTLQGAEGLVLVYHRDPFIGVDHQP